MLGRGGLIVDTQKDYLLLILAFLMKEDYTMIYQAHSRIANLKFTKS
jgi:hypothetical protein